MRHEHPQRRITEIGITIVKVVFPFVVVVFIILVWVLLLLLLLVVVSSFFGVSFFFPFFFLFLVVVEVRIGHCCRRRPCPSLSFAPFFII
jgi:hypothetical protein